MERVVGSKKENLESEVMLKSPFWEKLKKVKIKLKSKRKEKNTTNNTYSLGRDKKSNERIYNNKIIVMKQGTMRRNPKVTKKNKQTHSHLCWQNRNDHTQSPSRNTHRVPNYNLHLQIVPIGIWCEWNWPLTNDLHIYQSQTENNELEQ